MIVEGAFCKRLLSVDAITALVGDRVYRGFVPQSVTAQPVVRVQQLSGGLEYHLTGETGVGVARVQIDVWADTPSEAAAVAALIRAEFSAARGAVEGVTIRSCQLDNVLSLTEPPEDGKGTGDPRVMLEFGVRFDAD